MKPDQMNVNIFKHTVYIGKTTYWYEPRNGHRIWHRISTKYAWVDDERVLIKELEEAESRGEGPPDEWEPLEHRVKNGSKLKLLNNIVDRALEQEMRRRRKQKLLRQKRRRERLASLQNDLPQQDIGSQKRTKWGIRVYSSDGKHYFVLGCWKSRKYSGRASIRIGQYLYTITQRDLKALLEELRRGIQPEKRQEPI